MSTSSAARTRLKVLIVEDSEFVHQIYRVAFRRLGEMELVHAHDGVQGLAALEQQRGAFDLIIADLQMPRMDGLTFVREVRRKPQHQMTHVMFCTTEGEDPKVMRELEQVAQTYLRKPFNLEQILAKLSEVLPQLKRQRGEG